MKLIICTKFHVNRMNCVESRRGEGSDWHPDWHPPPLKATYNYFFFEASRIKVATFRRYCLNSKEVLESWNQRGHFPPHWPDRVKGISFERHLRRETWSLSRKLHWRKLGPVFCLLLNNDTNMKNKLPQNPHAIYLQMRSSLLLRKGSARAKHGNKTLSINFSNCIFDQPSLIRQVSSFHLTLYLKGISLKV